MGGPLVGLPNDLILDNPVRVTIDNDLPDVPALTLGAFVQPGYTVIIGGTASDPTSYVAQVDVKRQQGGFSAATGTALWAFPVAIPNTPTGAVPITVRAADAVNNTNTAAFNLTIDGVSPALTVGLNPGDLRRVRRNASGAWTLPISGTVTDALAGFDSLTLQVGASANAVLTPTAIAPGRQLEPRLPLRRPVLQRRSPSHRDLHPDRHRARHRPTGGNPTTQVIPFIIDMTPPTVDLLSHEDERSSPMGTVLTGTVRMPTRPLPSVEVAFVSAETALAPATPCCACRSTTCRKRCSSTITASAQTSVYCLDDCPTSGVDGADGTAAAFDGDDLLRTFEPIDLPESGLTTALWFKTTCANCGLFSAIQGRFPRRAGHDRELYLNGGNVCSAILVGASPRRYALLATNSSYADGQWHQVVHSLGTGGNALYVDGQLAVSSPTTASTFAAQDGVLIGYAPEAAAPYLTGMLDDVVIYEGALPRRRLPRSTASGGR